MRPLDEQDSLDHPAQVRLVARVVADEPGTGPGADLTGSTSTGTRSGIRPGRVARTGRVLYSLLMVGLVVFLGVFGGASDRPAQAGLMDDLCWAITPPYVGAGPDMYGGGVDGLLPGWTPLQQGWDAFVEWQAGQNQSYEGRGNYYEQFGMAGTNWVVFTGGTQVKWDSGDRIWRDDEIEDNNCFPVMTLAANMASQTVFDVAKAITRSTISGVQLALSDDVFESFWPIIDEVVENLRDWLYLGFIEPLVMIAAVWMAWNGLVKRRTTMTFQAMIWMLVAVSASLVFMGNPSGVARGLNNVLGSLTQAVTDATLTMNFEEPLEGEGGTVNDGYVCETTDGAQRTQRMMGCGIWKAMVFTPWSVGQFGTADPNGLPGVPEDVTQGHRTGAHQLDYHNDVRLAQLDAQAYSHDDGANGVSSDMIDSKRNSLVAITYGANMYLNPQWAGDNPGSRFTIAISALLASIIGGALLTILAITLLTIHMFMLTLTVTAPLFLLAGVHPGMGRRIALRWFELWLGTFIKRLIVTFLIALLVGFYQMIFTMGVAWGTQLMMILAVSIATFLYRKPVMEMFSNVNMGGMRLEGIEDRQVSKKSLAMATGATVAGVAATKGMVGTGASKRQMAKAAVKAGGKTAVRTAHGTSASKAAYAGGRIGSRQGRQELKGAGLKKPGAPGTSPPGTGQNNEPGRGASSGPDLGVYEARSENGPSRFLYKDQTYATSQEALAVKGADRARAEAEHGQVQRLTGEDGKSAFMFGGKKYATQEEADRARSKAVRKSMAGPPPKGQAPEEGATGPDMRIVPVAPKFDGDDTRYQYRGQTYQTQPEAQAAQQLDMTRLKEYDKLVPPVVASRSTSTGKEQFQFDGAVYDTRADADAARNAMLSAGFAQMTHKSAAPDLKIRTVPPSKPGEATPKWEATYKGKGYRKMSDAIEAKIADERRAKQEVSRVQHVRDKSTGQETFSFGGQTYTSEAEAVQARKEELHRVMAQPTPDGGSPSRVVADTAIRKKAPAFRGDAEMFAYRGVLYATETEATRARDADNARVREHAPQIVEAQNVVDGTTSYEVGGYSYPSKTQATVARDAAVTAQINEQPPAPPTRPDLRISEVKPNNGDRGGVTYNGVRYASKAEAMKVKKDDHDYAQQTVPKVQRLRSRGGEVNIKFAGRAYDSLEAAQADRKEAVKRVMANRQRVPDDTQGRRPVRRP